jgi:hypothetical protein
MVTYEETYKSFISYRAKIGLPPISFEDWMHRRDEPVKSPAQKTQEFLSSRKGGGGLPPENQ